ncbi:hypothetical protein NRK67_01715 [Fusobacteria bacterium ZRK30]|nr:hypothetical protein NRK67_01715 [Fusobacteria bacterium ZRK30]
MNEKKRLVMRFLDNSTSTWIKERELRSKGIDISKELINLEREGKVIRGVSRRTNERIYTTVKKYKNEGFITRMLDSSKGVIKR